MKNSRHLKNLITDLFAELHRMDESKRVVRCFTVFDSTSTEPLREVKQYADGTIVKRVKKAKKLEPDIA